MLRYYRHGSVSCIHSTLNDNDNTISCFYNTTIKIKHNNNERDNPLAHYWKQQQVDTTYIVYYWLGSLSTFKPMEPCLDKEPFISKGYVWC